MRTRSTTKQETSESSDEIPPSHLEFQPHHPRTGEYRNGGININASNSSDEETSDSFVVDDDYVSWASEDDGDYTTEKNQATNAQNFAVQAHKSTQMANNIAPMAPAQNFTAQGPAQMANNIAPVGPPPPKFTGIDMTMENSPPTFNANFPLLPPTHPYLEYMQQMANTPMWNYAYYSHEIPSVVYQDGSNNPIYYQPYHYPANYFGPGPTAFQQTEQPQKKRHREAESSNPKKTTTQKKNKNVSNST